MKTPQQQQLTDEFWKDHSFEKLEEKAWEYAKKAVEYYKSIVKLPHQLDDNTLVTHGDNKEMYDFADFYAKKAAHLFYNYRRLLNDDQLRKLWKLVDSIDTYYQENNTRFQTNII